MHISADDGDILIHKQMLGMCKWTSAKVKVIFMWPFSAFRKRHFHTDFRCRRDASETVCYPWLHFTEMATVAVKVSHRKLTNTTTIIDLISQRYELRAEMCLNRIPSGIVQKRPQRKQIGWIAATFRQSPETILMCTCTAILTWMGRSEGSCRRNRSLNTSRSISSPVIIRFDLTR